MFYSALTHLNCYFIDTSFHNLSDLTEVTVKIQNEIYSCPESPFHLIYMEQTSVKKKATQNKTQKNAKPLEKFYKVLKHILLHLN